MLIIDYEAYKKKVHGCFMGKSIGGTLGMPFEGDLSTHHITYYDPVPTEMLPNDDLDLQVVHLETIMRTGFPVCRYHLGEVWKQHISDFAPDEYGPARSNHRNKIYAPVSGRFRSKFGHGMGAAIRSELWACLAPGSPALAAKLSKEDASSDHNGEGVYAEMFLAAVESAAFIESDIMKLIKAGLENIPSDCVLYSAFNDVLQWWSEDGDIFAVREKILEKYYAPNWTDVVINLSFIVLAMLSAEGSFDKAVCGAVALGYDADCTGATIGSIFGILAPDSIGERWKEPIGDKLVLTSSIINMHEAATIDEFCESIIAAAAEAEKYYKPEVHIDIPEGAASINIAPPWTLKHELVTDWNLNSAESLIACEPFLISLIYPEQVAAYPQTGNKYKLRITNISDTDAKGTVMLAAPDGWEVKGSSQSISIPADGKAELEFEIIPRKAAKRCPLNVLTITIKANGMSFTAEAGLPISIPWTVTDSSGKVSAFESAEPFFKVPEGAFTYRTVIKSTANKRVRITACGTKPSRLYINGELKWEHDGKHYVPAFHRDEGWFDTDIMNGLNEITVEFGESGGGEFFLGFGSLYFCTQWDDSIEYIEPEEKKNV